MSGWAQISEFKMQVILLIKKYAVISPIIYLTRLFLNFNFIFSNSVD